MLHHRLRAAAGARTGDIPSDFKARYLMDEMSGSGTLLDETGNFNGTYTSVSSVTGVQGTALEYSGISPSRINIDTAIGANPTVFSLSGWSRVPLLTANGLYFMLAYRDSATPLIQWYVEGGSLKLAIRSSGTAIQIRDTAPAIENAWFHWVLRFNKAGGTTIHVNNSLLYTISNSFSGTLTSNIASIGPFNSNGYSYGIAISGQNDLYTLYDRFITEDEITKLYNEV